MNVARLSEIENVMKTGIKKNRLNNSSNIYSPNNPIYLVFFIIFPLFYLIAITVKLQ